ncbi:probable E3 ubiquitin-protein ligase HERC4 [Thrips palmi]|uniref:Probable E3 ubiquitin-protein ligase HERC4 n=1 Tax=Thrips palmi TaxID=161013 RepID=A0A6P8YKW3_THRPL|nr:probable E3 ubiquitin-protein ligase HERC4 [Thrips palmi]XP_034237401.1 probable E3 ubiquitin-protein ligase HERC4 [Thrips palmi]XP_034237402.1 probable E3 ubiquitin-protein ligase HERC4 [Thrips palmi]
MSPEHEEESKEGEEKMDTLSMQFSRLCCWGNTTNGELGLGGIEESHILSPRELLLPSHEDINIQDVVCGESHTLMLTAKGEVFSCGNNDHGQLGRELHRTRPQLITSLSDYSIQMVACGGSHSVAVTKWGQIFSWGSDSFGQLGLNLTGSDDQWSAKTVKNLALSTVVQIACGQNHTMALTNDGHLYSWGCNRSGQLGLGTTSEQEKKPTLITSLAGIPMAFIACGSNHSFAVSKSGAVFGWGKNSCGQLGLSDCVNRKYPAQLKSLRSIRVKYVACGEDFSVFLTSDGGVFTCGAGMHGQLGHGSLTNELLPRKVTELMGSTVTQVACGRRHTLALVPSRGRVYAFGLGGAGQLGNKYTGNSSTPQVVVGPWLSPSGVSLVKSTHECVVKKIAAGGDHCFALVTLPQEQILPDDFRLFSPHTQVLTLQQKYLQDCEKYGADSQVDLELITYLETVFNSQACFNASFLMKNDYHYCCTSKHHGVEIEEAESFFSAIGRIEHNTIKDIIATCICQRIVPSLVSSPPDVETLRIYLTLPMYHECENPKNYEKIHIPFAKAISELKNEARKIVTMWWGAQSSDYFERLIRMYRNVVMYVLRLPSQHQKESSLSINQVIMSALDMLFLLNQVNKEVGQKVPYNSFYLNDLQEVVDIQVDYVRWVAQIDPSIMMRLSPALPPPGTVHFCNYPFVFNAEAKTLLLETDQSLQMQSAMQEATTDFLMNVFGGINHYLVLNVSRENIVDDTIRELFQCDTKDLKKPLKIKFCGEEAEDAGGVRKEFFMLLLKEILDPAYGMFKSYDETNTIWFSEVTFEDEIMYYLIGLLCGLAIYNFTIINLPFPLALYKKLLDEPVSLQDVKDLSPTIAKSLQDILDYKDNDFEDVFGLTFEMSTEVFGEVKLFPLKAGGGDIPVTLHNKSEYVDLYVDMLLNKVVEKHFKAFSQGFLKVCGGRVLQLFHAAELMAVVIGNENYDWEELQRHAEYKNGYKEDDPTIRLFWEVFMELPVSEKKKFLMFLTGTDRIPIQGMKAIKIIFQPTTDDKYLPVAHTCFNLLDLPRYGTKEKLRYKLLQAIQQNLGFSLV